MREGLLGAFDTGFSGGSCDINACIIGCTQVDSVADRMSRAISHAVRRMIEEGTLPEACYYSPDVKEVSSKQRRLLGPQALLTTAAAFPIAAAARRAAGILLSCTVL